MPLTIAYTKYSNILNMLKLSYLFLMFVQAQQLCTVSVVVRIDAQLDERTVVIGVDRSEERIVSQSRALLPEGSRVQIEHKVDELDTLLRAFGLQTRLLVMERANSIALYFVCMTLAALMSLHDQWLSQKLRRNVMGLFTFLSGARDTVGVKRLTWLIEYQRCLEFFNFVQGKQMI